MKAVISVVLVSVLALSACAKKESPLPSTPATPLASQSAPMVAPTPILPPMAPAAPVSSNPDDVLVDVNGKKLTRGEAGVRAAKMMERMQGRVPPARMQMMQAQIMGQIVEAYIAETLLTDKFDSLKITVSKDEESKELERLKEDLPEGMTLEKVMKENSVTQEQISQLVQEKVKQDKLLAEYKKTVVPTKEQVEEFKKENADQMTIPENVSARHILLSTSAADDEAAKAKKKRDIEDIRKQLLNGADFGELAMKHSSCPSRQRGGNLGQFPRGKMAPPFERAAFSQKEGEIGEVVETQFGYHVIQVTRHEDSKTFTDQQVETIVRERNRRSGMRDILDQLKSAANIKRTQMAPPAMMPGMAPMAPTPTR